MCWRSKQLAVTSICVPLTGSNFNQSSAVLFAAAALPQPPEKLLLLEATCDSIKLAWNSTDNMATAPINSYLVQYRPNGSSDDYVEISVYKPEVLVGGLDALTAYEFHVLSVSDAGRSVSATSIIVTTSHAGQQAATLFFFLCIQTVNYYSHDRYWSHIISQHMNISSNCSDVNNSMAKVFTPRPRSWSPRLGKSQNYSWRHELLVRNVNQDKNVAQ